MDHNNDGKITFEDFIGLYHADIGIYGWFELLN